MRGKIHVFLKLLGRWYYVGYAFQGPITFAKPSVTQYKGICSD
jgi:hypothetical protein